MSRVSVAEGQKPKPKQTFRFLRKDEGRLSYTEGASAPKEEAPKPRRDSQSLREAIAHDMRNAKGQDPLGEVVVAVPKRAPPPAASNNPSPAAKKTSVARGKPAWVPPTVPVQEEEVEEDNYYDDDPNHRQPSQHTEEDAIEPGRYRGGTPRSGNPRSTPQTNTQNRYRDPVEDYEPPAGRNYFKRREEPRTNARPPSVMEDDDLLRKLEDEIRAAQEERARYLQSKYALDRERREFEEHKYNVEQELEDERAELDLLKRKEKKEAQKGMKSVEERYRSVSALLATEREVNRKLLEENDTLRQQLDDLTSTMREKQKVSNSEVARLRRDVESLSKRNAELLAMTKESQLEVLAPPAREKSASQSDRRSESRTSNAITNDPNNSYQPPAATTNVTNPNTRATKGSTLQPTLDVEDVQEPEGGYASSHVVLDFTPRAKDEGMAEKRSREMEERMKREEAERQNRKLQREKAAEEKRVRELEEAARREEEKTKKLEGDRLKRREEEQQQKASKADATAADVSNERKRSGHPPTTPRGTKSTVTKSKPVKESTKKKLPTKEELIGDEEEIPAEDFPNDALVSQTNIGDNASKREVLYRSGKREIHYANGTVKVVLPSGHTILHFANGDIKRMFPSGKSTYWYDAAQTLHTQRPDGTQTFEFQSTGQVERHHPDGSKEILYPDGIFKTVKADGSEETFFSEK